MHVQLTSSIHIYVLLLLSNIVDRSIFIFFNMPFSFLKKEIYVTLTKYIK